MAQGALQAPVLPAVFLQQIQTLAFGIRRLHIGFLTRGTEAAAQRLHTQGAAPAGDGLVLHLQAQIMAAIAEGRGNGAILDFVMLIAGPAATQAQDGDTRHRFAPFAAQIPALAGQVHHGNAARATVLVLMVMPVVIAAMQMVAMGMAACKTVLVARQAVLGLLAGIGQAQIAVVTDP